jgi:serine/threonine-protein kinase
VADKYVVDGVVGSGGMGHVYRATETHSGRQVAIKVVSPELARDLAAARRFIREVRLTARISHPNVVSVLDYGALEDGRLFLVMELLVGEPLSDLVRDQGALDLGRAVRVTAQVLEALHAAHVQGIVHRDMKPGNIFLTRSEGGEETVKVLDFGIAKSADGAALTQLTSAGQFLGTLSYASPEQVTGDRLDGRSDIYSVGVVMFTMLAGHAPFRSADVSEMLLAHVKEPVPPLVRSRPDLPDCASIQRVLERLMAKRPAARPADALEARDLVLGLQRPISEPRSRPSEHPRDTPEPTDGATAEFTDGLAARTRTFLGHQDQVRPHDTLVLDPARLAPSPADDTGPMGPPSTLPLPVGPREPTVTASSVSPGAGLLGGDPLLRVLVGLALVAAVSAVVAAVTVVTRTSAGPPPAPAPALAGETASAARGPPGGGVVAVPLEDEDAEESATTPRRTRREVGSPGRAPLFFETDPPGARLKVGGSPAGTTPARVLLPTGKSHAVRLEKDGYAAQSFTVLPTRSARVYRRLQLLPSAQPVRDTPPPTPAPKRLPTRDEDLYEDL